MEWKNKFNPFNSWKGLTWYESHYVPIIKWWQGEDCLPPPIEVSLDICHNCNFKCSHCNSQAHTNKEKGAMDRRTLSSTLELVARFGARAVCFGGGGEPTLNKNLSHGIFLAKVLGMESAVATNGSFNNKKLMEAMMNCKWVAFSVDAATQSMFKKVHGVGLLGRVTGNIQRMVAMKKVFDSDVFISYRFLITPDNEMELYKAGCLAKRLGVDAFHARPADLERKDLSARDSGLAAFIVLTGFTNLHELTDDSFVVATATHKFDNNFKAYHPFKKCMASPLVLQVCSDGYSYVCPDHKLEERFRLCETKDIIEYWGSREHRMLLRNINPKLDCSRCTWVPYQEQIENLWTDKMHRNFP